MPAPVKSTRSGECRNCQVIWNWRACAALPGVGRGRAFCKDCGNPLHRVARGRADVFPVLAGDPLRAAAAEVVRADRVRRLAARHTRFSVHPFPAPASA